MSPSDKLTLIGQARSSARDTSNTARATTVVGSPGREWTAHSLFRSQELAWLGAGKPCLRFAAVACTIAYGKVVLLLHSVEILCQVRA